MTAETHEDVININEINTANDPESIDESWALMLLLENETDPNSNLKLDQSKIVPLKANRAITRNEDEVITISPQERIFKSPLSAIECQALNFKKSKSKKITNTKKRVLPSFRSLLGI